MTIEDQLKEEQAQIAKEEHLNKMSPIKKLMTRNPQNNADPLDAEWKYHSVPKCTNREYPSVLSKIINDTGFGSVEYQEVQNV